MDKLEITFADGSTLRCQGVLKPETSKGELRGNEDGTFTEVRDSVQFVITEGMLSVPSVVNPDLSIPIRLPKGLYLIDKDGLWRHM